MGSSSLIVLLIAGIAFSAGGIAVARLFVKGTKNPAKGQTYECGIPSEGSPWNQFNVGYYLYALIFLLFDVELAFLYPWAVIARELKMFGFWEMLIYIGLVLVGFFYIWKKGILDWNANEKGGL